MQINRITTAALLTAALGLGPVTGAAAAPVEKPAKSVSLRPAEGGGGWQGDGLSLNAEDNRKVDDFLDHAQRAERSISPMVRAAARISDATVVGFDHRLKSPDSLKRKVATSLKETPGETADQALARINDSVRYTLQWPDGRYVHGVALASSVLAAWGNDSVKWSNTWGRKQGYKAVNSAWRDPLEGHVFEVQFHTPQSKWAQEATHKLYEEQRLPSTTPERAKELQAQQDAIFAAVPVPAGAAELAAPERLARTLPAAG
ncbi:ATP nucleotide 3'-pyrophosphokinase [Streptomyces sp. ET3-23]|uniref:ATP nucleotide 3'-pyrophosphokinase n=1 Tax=Streptomyces sp. ET3-23 TaxID=2885643 RepID=UPI001D12397A|nr:ATP nucleotide 3'-pyrophosphokinase [Streptomyces sp. ET3-23]MCC2275867.1 ATP nucleotide 3'-pyrophosphokinase [Streptomyces sp. ET3-23]